MLTRLRFFTVLCFVLVSGLALPAAAATVSLGWDANPEPDVAGYRLAYGSQRGVYTTAVDVGNTTRWTIPNLKAGTSYYFIVRAYNSDGLISDPSNEVSFTVPVVTQSGRLTYDQATGIWSQPLHDQFGNTPANVAGWSTLSGDFNGDGTPDLFLYNPTTGAWLRAVDERDGNYSFVGSTWAPGWTPMVADFNGDHLSDVFIYNATTGQYFLCLSVASASDFSYITGRWAPGWSVYPADFNGDGRSDLFLYNAHPTTADPNGGLWFRVLTQPDSSFAYLQGDVRWATDWQVTPADFDGDGHSDLFLYRASGQYFQVAFTAAGTQYSGGAWAPGWSITAGRFNADKKTDLFLYNRANGMWFVVITGPGGFEYYNGLWAPNWQIKATDFNGDGLSDLLLYNTSNGMWFETTTLGPGSFAFVNGSGLTGNGLSIVR